MPTQSDTWPERAHEHTSSCYWDLRICRWVCAPQPQAADTGAAAPEPVAVADPLVVPAAVAAGAAAVIGR